FAISMTGVAEPIAGNNIVLQRALTANMTQANYPTLWGRLIADKPAVNITQNFYGQPLAPPLFPGWRQIMRPAAATTSTAPGVVVGGTRYDFVNGDPYLSLNVLVKAGYDWETYNSIATETTAVAGASTVGAEIIAACGGPIFVTEQPGLIRLSQAVGGRSIESF